MLKAMSLLSTDRDFKAALPDELARARTMLEAERSRVAAVALFARKMSHDISNYVTVVRTYSELLLADLPAAGSGHADALEIHRASDALIDYMHRSLRFARTASARPGSINLDQVLNDVVTGNAASGRLRADFTSGASVRIDATWLADAMSELIANAAEASKADAPIHVRSWNESLSASIVDGGVPIDTGTWAVVEIADDGAGMGAELRMRALDPFVTTKIAERGGCRSFFHRRPRRFSSGGARGRQCLQQSLGNFVQWKHLCGRV